MKKISLFALALCTSAAVFAQDNQPQLRTPMEVKTRFGLRAGANLADLTFTELPSGSDITEAEHKTSFNGSVFVNVPLSSTFRFQPEVGFSSQGGKLKGPSGPGSGSFGEQDLHYINVPLNFQLMTKKGFFIQTGPQLGFLLDAKIKEDGSSAEIQNEEEFDKIDFSWTGGVGYLSRIGLGVDLRYNIGIANIIEDNTNGMGTAKNSVGQFSLIYHFGANK
jgi:hypothetical protein